MEIIEYKVEQINVSDDKYTLTEISIQNGVFVERGTVLCTYESSKSDYEVVAFKEGYVYFNDKIRVNDTLSVGQLLAIVVNEILDADYTRNYFEEKSGGIITLPNELSNERIITKKAKLLIEKYGIFINQIPSDFEIIDESVVEKIINANSIVKNTNNIYITKFPERDLPQFSFPKKLALIGAGKSAMQVMDILYSQNSHTITCLYDDSPALQGNQLLGIPILGPVDFNQIRNDYESGVFNEIIICFSGMIDLRRKYFEQIKEKNIPIANLIHRRASISPYAKIGEGNIIFANVVVSSFAVVGDNNFISAFSNIEHHNVIGSHNTFGPAVMFSGSCTIGDSIKFGTGIYIEPRITIGSNSIISSGSIIRTNIPSNSIVRVKSNEEVKVRR